MARRACAESKSEGGRKGGRAGGSWACAVLEVRAGSEGKLRRNGKKRWEGGENRSELERNRGNLGKIWGELGQNERKLVEFGEISGKVRTFGMKSGEKMRKFGDNEVKIDEKSGKNPRK